MIDPIFSHRSIRKFKNQPISPSIVKTILEAGTRASTTGNMQVYSMIATTDEAIKKQLCEAHFKQQMVMEAPLHITFCADFNRFTQWCKLSKADPGYDNFLSFFTAAIDALLASQNVALEAEAHGLGICYLGTTTYMAGKLIDILKIPALVIPVTSLVIGYPDENPPITDRLPLQAVVHEQVYQDYDADQIAELYKEKEQLSSNIQLLGINQKETLAQIFTDKRYTRKDNVTFSNSFLEVLKRQGFMNQ